MKVIFCARRQGWFRGTGGRRIVAFRVDNVVANITDTRPPGGGAVRRGLSWVRYTEVTTIAGTARNAQLQESTT